MQELLYERRERAEALPGRPHMTHRHRREVRTNLWYLVQRRAHLADRPELGRAEVGEFVALTWALRIFRQFYAEIEFLEQADLSFSYRGRIRRGEEDTP